MRGNILSWNSGFSSHTCLGVIEIVFSKNLICTNCREMTHSIDMAALEHWRHLQFMEKFVNLQKKKKTVEEKKWTTSLVNMPEKKRLHPQYPLQLQCLKTMVYKEIIPIQVSINMEPLCSIPPVHKIWQQVAALVVQGRGVVFTALTICTVEHPAAICTNLRIVDQVNMIYKLTCNSNIPNLFMNRPHQGNKNT